MREILFQGKRTSNGQWVEGSLLLFTTEECVPGSDGACFICPDVLNKYEVDPETVGQYTGLDDMKGVRIFEGDIVSVPMRGYRGNETQEIGIVDHLKGAFCAKWITDEGRDFLGYLHSVEVIGNIHDHPHFLEG